jgi:hypothetical protein
MVEADTLGRGPRVGTTAVGADWFFSRLPIDGPEAVRRRFRPGVVSVVPGASVEVVLSESHVAEYYSSVTHIEVCRGPFPVLTRHQMHTAISITVLFLCLLFRFVYHVMTSLRNGEL